MMNYALRWARTSDVEEDRRWSLALKESFTKKLDRETGAFVGYSFAFGAYLPNLLYLDKEWVIENIDKIFYEKDEYRWFVTFWAICTILARFMLLFMTCLRSADTIKRS